MSGGEPAPDRLVQERNAKLVRFIGVVYNVVLHRDPETAEIQRHGNELVRGLPPIDFLNNIVFSEERRGQPNLYVVPGHFYSPIVNPAELHHYLRGLPSAAAGVPGVEIDRDAMIATWESLLPFLSTSPFSDAAAPGQHYGYENPAFGYGDGVVLQAMIRHRRPKRLIEVGSGHSSACTVDTVDRFLDGACELTFIEPHPKHLRAALGERAAGLRIIESPVQRVSRDVFAELESGDVLFIDSTHVLRTGSDVCFELFEVLPRLASGVAVHFHDVFWPFEYPRSWILDDNRSWNELYALRAFLTDNERWRITFFSDYFAKIERERVERDLPRFAATSGASLWLERR